MYEVISAKIKSRNKLFGVAIKDSNKINFFEKINTDFYKIIEKDLENEELMERILLSNAKKISKANSRDLARNTCCFASRNFKKIKIQSLK